MKFSKITLAFATFALAVASAASNTYHITLGDNAWVGQKELKAGEYRIQVEGDKAVIKSGKNSVEVPVKVEKADRKYPNNQILMRTENNRQQLEEIRIGGSTTRIVMSTASQAGQ